MRPTVKVLSYLLISSIFTSIVFAGDSVKKKLLSEKEQMELEESAIAPEIEPVNSISVRAVSKSYNGFQGTIVTPKIKQYPDGPEGVVLELLDNWDEIPPEDVAKAQEKLTMLLNSMPYEELKNVFYYNSNPQVESALYQSWLTTQRSGQNGRSVSRTAGTEAEPNGGMSSANAVSTDTTSGYLTAYDEDWYSVAVGTAGDWVFETHATSGSENVGDTKLYLYAANSATSHIEYNDNGGTDYYSKVTHRFEDSTPPTSDLFFSEYAEGTSNNKYLEIYNGTGATISLDDYAYPSVSNAPTTAGQYEHWNTFDAGATVASGDVYVISHGSASAGILAEADEHHTYLSNGDDGYALVKGTAESFVVLDVIGQNITESNYADPGSGWAVAGVSNATKDHTLIRKGSVLSGNTNWTASAGTNTADSEWEVTDKPTATYTSSTLGSHTITATNLYYIKVTGSSGTYAGTYLLTVGETAFNTNNGTLVINEINYNPATTTDSTEFIELYNAGTAAVNLSGWNVLGILSSGTYSLQAPTDYLLPSGASIAAGGYYVIARDSASYVNLYGSEANVYWGYSSYVYSGWPNYTYSYYDLNDAGETIELKDSLGGLVDVVTYDDVAPWPTGADGGGSSLELISSTTDNDVGSNWRGHGGVTPGAANSAQPDLSMGSSITSYQTVGSSVTETFQLNNNGDASLSADAVFATESFVAGSPILSEGFETWPPTNWTMYPSSGSGSWQQDSGNDFGPGSVNSGSYSAFFNDYDYSSSISGSMTTPAVDLTGVSSPALTFYYYDGGGSDVVVVGASTDGTTFTTIYTTATSVTPWTKLTVNLSAYEGNNVYIKFSGTSVYGTSNPHIDDVAIAGGSYVSPPWISATVPTAAIAAGDSGNISITFDGSSFTSDTSLSTTMTVHNNDPQDFAKTFTATMYVRADTAILTTNYSDALSYSFTPASVGDTSGSKTVTITNDGGANLVVDSTTFSGGSLSQFFSGLSGPDTLGANMTGTFPVRFAPTVSGLARDTLTVHTNTDSSSSGSKLKFSGLGYNSSEDTLYTFSGTGSDGWIIGSYMSNYDGYLQWYPSSYNKTAITPRSAFAPGDTIYMRLSNPNTGSFDARVYFSETSSATLWSGWAALDTITIAAGPRAGTRDYVYTSFVLPAGVDTGYVGFHFQANQYTTYYHYLTDVLLPKPVPASTEAGSGIPEGYTLESFESTVPPEEWTMINDGDANGWTKSSTSANSGTYAARIQYSSSAHDDWLITPKMSIGENDSITLYAKNYSASYIERFNVMVSTGSNVKEDFTAALASSVGPPTSWTKYSYDLSAYMGADIYVGIQATSTNEYYLFIDDVLLPWTVKPNAELTLSSSALDFYSVAVDTAAGTGSKTLNVNVVSSGQDTLRGSIVSGSTSFTISADTVDLVPEDTLALTITYAPSAVGDDSSGITFYTNNGGVTDTTAISVEGSAVEADLYSHFEFDNYEDAGYTRYNTNGGVHWMDASGSGSSGSNYVKATPHKFGGESWLVLPTFTADADGERLYWDMKVSSASPTAATTVFLMKLSGNAYTDLANAIKLDSLSVSATAADITTSWATYIYDDYLNPNDLGSSLVYAFKYVDTDDAADGTANGATVSIDNIGFANAPNVPILVMGDGKDEDIVHVKDGFNFDDVYLGQNLGGDTLYVDSMWTTDANLSVTLDADTVAKQAYLSVDMVLNPDSIVMGQWSAYIHFTHNDTFVSTGHDSFMVKADFADLLEDFEDGDLGSLLARELDGDDHNWTASMITGGPNGSYGAYSNKVASTPIGNNFLRTRLHEVSSGDKFIFHAKYTSTNDPDWMHVLISNDMGTTWVGLDTVNMMGKTSWKRYEYDLTAYVGDYVRLAIEDLNYGNSISDKLWVDRVMLPKQYHPKSIASYRAMNADSTYMYKDSVFTIGGLVTAAGSSFGTYGPAYMQDSTGGIAVNDYPSSGFADSAQVGDMVIVKGTGAVYNNLFQIADISFIITEQGVSVTPEVVSLSSLSGTAGEGLEGQLLKVADVTWVDESDWNPSASSSGFNMEVTADGAVASGVVFSGEFGGALDVGNTYTSPTGSEPWAGFANEDTGLYPLSFPSGGEITFTGATDGTNADVYFRFEYNPHPDTEPSFNTDTVTVSGTAEASYSVEIPTQGVNTYSSFLFYVVTRDAPVTLTNVAVTRTYTATVRIDSDADIDVMPTGSLDIVGVLGQYSSSNAYGGFQLLPRSQDDLTGYHKFSGTVTDASTGNSLPGVAVELGTAEAVTGTDGSYAVRDLGDWTSIAFSKEGYTDAVFSVDVSDGGFSTLNVSMHYAVDSLILSNSFETVGSEGAVDTSSTATGTQWFLSGGLDLSVRNSSGVYTTVNVGPTQGSTMLVVTNVSVAGTGVGGYASNSYSLWIMPEVVDFSGVDSDAILTMDLWVNSESNYDDFRVLVKSDSSATTWTVIKDIAGGYNDGWSELAVDLGAVSNITDARIAFLFDTDASVTNGFGVAVDNVQIGSWDHFVAAVPADLEAESMAAGHVDLVWGAPLSDTTTVDLPTVDVSAFLDVEEIVRNINEINGNGSISAEQWLEEMMAHNPRFNTHPRLKHREVSYLPQRTMNASRDLMSYNVFRRVAGEEFTLIDSTHSTTYTDMNVTNYTYYYYRVTAVYGEGESDPTSEALGVPGMVVAMVPDLTEDFENISLGETIPDRWTIFKDGGIDTVDWVVGGTAEAGTMGSYTFPVHTDFAYVNGYSWGYNQNVQSTLISPFYDFTNAEGAILVFDSYAQEYSSSYGDMDVSYRIGYGEWNVVKDMSYDHTGGWETIEVPVGEEIMGENYVQLGFVYNDDNYYNYGWGIDNVQLVDAHAEASVSVDSISLVSADNDMDSLTFTISNAGDWRLEYDIEMDFGGGTNMPRSVEGSTITPSVDNFAPGEGFSMTLTLHNASTDADYLDTVTVTFPAGVTVRSASNFTVSTTSVLVATVSDQTVTWADTDGGYGEVTGGTTVTCEVVLDIDNSVGHQLTVDYTISGDDYGSEPHDISDSFTLYDIDISFNPASGAIAAAQDQAVGVSIGFLTMGNWEGDVVVNTSDPVRPELRIPIRLRTQTAPSSFYLMEPINGDTVRITTGLDSLSVRWSRSADADGDEVSYALMIEGGPLNIFSFLDTVLSADTFMGDADFDLPMQEVAALLTSFGATPAYLTVRWNVTATDGIEITTSSNGPYTATLDLGFMLGLGEEAGIPDVFALHQNYPNPFNPLTTIMYDVPEQGMVKMEIYDLLGRKVNTLVNHSHQPGYHAVIWNGTNEYGKQLSSGMYFYYIQAGDFRSVKKLMLVK